MDAPDEQTRDERIVSLMPLVHKIARKLTHKVPGAEYQDLVSEGLIGAIQSVDRWDPEMGVALGAFANQRISGQMYDYLRQYGPLSRSHYAKVKEGEETFFLGSLDEPVLHLDGAEGADTLIDMLPDDEDTIARMIDILAIREVIRMLPAKHREVLVQYYYEGLTLKAIGERYGVTESRICQKMNKAVEYAYRYLEEQPQAVGAP